MLESSGPHDDMDTLVIRESVVRDQARLNKIKRRLQKLYGHMKPSLDRKMALATMLEEECDMDECTPEDEDDPNEEDGDGVEKKTPISPGLSTREADPMTSASTTYPTTSTSTTTGIRQEIARLRLMIEQLRHVCTHLNTFLTRFFVGL